MKEYLNLLVVLILCVFILGYCIGVSKGEEQGMLEADRYFKCCMDNLCKVER